MLWWPLDGWHVVLFYSQKIERIINMGRKIEVPIIETVEFYYNGSDKQFNLFLKNIIKDYISEDNLLPDDVEKVSEKSA